MQDKGLDIELVEQPVKAHDFEGLAYVTKYSNIPVLADESVFSPEDAFKILQMKAADLINIKLMKCGGIYNALKIISMAEIVGVECMIGCMLEAKISVNAAVHLACAKGMAGRGDGAFARAASGPALPAFLPAALPLPGQARAAAGEPGHQQAAQRQRQQGRQQAQGENERACHEQHAQHGRNQAGRPACGGAIGKEKAGIQHGARAKKRCECSAKGAGADGVFGAFDKTSNKTPGRGRMR